MNAYIQIILKFLNVLLFRITFTQRSGGNKDHKSLFHNLVFAILFCSNSCSVFSSSSQLRHQLHCENIINDLFNKHKKRQSPCRYLVAVGFKRTLFMSIFCQFVYIKCLNFIQNVVSNSYLLIFKIWKFNIYVKCPLWTTGGQQEQFRNLIQ